MVWYSAKGYLETVEQPEEGIDQLSKRLRTLLSHYYRESHSKSLSGHADWFEQIWRVKQILLGNEVDVLEEPETIVPKAKASKSKASKAGKAKPVAVAKQVSEAPNIGGLKRLASSLDVSSLSGPPPKQPKQPVISIEPEASSAAVVPLPPPFGQLTRSKAAPPSACVNIPPSRFPVFASSDTESDGEVPAATPGGQEAAEPANEQPPVTPAKALPFVVTPDVHTLSPVPSKPAASTHAVPIVFPKSSQYRSGFQNRKGAWIKILDGSAKFKYYTTVMDIEGEQVWGTWDLTNKKVKAPISSLKPSEMADALSSIAEKYVKGKNTGVERLILYKGRCVDFEVFKSLRHSVETL